MTFDQIINNLKNKVYHPIYFLMGEEPYFIDEISGYIADNVLSESEKGFNQTILYGRDIDVDTIISEAKRFPMMSNHQVLMIKEAQDIKNLDDLLPYVQNPLKSTILVMCYKYKVLDRRKKITKEIEKAGVVFESKKLYENRVQSWVANHLKTKGYDIDPRALMLLTEYIGNEISKIANELDKLMVNLEKGTQINVSHIELNIGISKDFNRFELQKAIGAKNFMKANQIVNYFSSNTSSHPIVVTLSSLFMYFSKVLMYHYITDKSKNNVAAVLEVNPYFVRDYELAARNYGVQKLNQIVAFLKETDLKSKGVGNSTTDGGELLKELVYKIMH